jgi:hypothetical protein
VLDGLIAPYIHMLHAVLTEDADAINLDAYEDVPTRLELPDLGRFAFEACMLLRVAREDLL